MTQRVNHPHMVYTEVQDLEQALKIIRDRKSAATNKASESPTRRQQVSRAKAAAAIRQYNTPISLSDRVIMAKGQIALRKARPLKPPAPEPWSREQVIAAYNNGRGHFQPRDLAKLARVNIHIVEKWLGFVDLTQCPLHRR